MTIAFGQGDAGREIGSPGLGHGVVDLDVKSASQCSANDIAAVSITLGRQAALDPFSELEETGAFLLVNSLTGATLAAGIVVTASGGDEVRAALPASFRLTRDMLAAGFCADLGSPEADAREFQRRAPRGVAFVFGRRRGGFI